MSAKSIADCAYSRRLFKKCSWRTTAALLANTPSTRRTILNGQWALLGVLGLHSNYATFPAH